MRAHIESEVRALRKDAKQHLELIKAIDLEGKEGKVMAKLTKFEAKCICPLCGEKEKRYVEPEHSNSPYANRNAAGRLLIICRDCEIRTLKGG